jgi:uncharacterized integral membrane protein
MRVFCFLILALVIAARTVFAVQNDENVSVRYFNQLPMYLGLGIVYILGTISGWSVVSMLKRSWRR